MTKTALAQDENPDDDEFWQMVADNKLAFDQNESVTDRTITPKKERNGYCNKHK